MSNVTPRRGRILTTHSELIAHWPAMVRAAQSIVRSQQDAEDCAAACLAQMCARPMDPCDNLEALLITVTKRRAIDLVRSHEAERRRETRLAHIAPVESHDLAQEVVDRAEARWFDTAARRHLRPHVYALLERLAADMPIGEAAAELGMTRRAAESHLLRARRALREALPRAMAGVVIAFGCLRRFSARTAGPALTAVSAGCVMLLPSVSGWLHDTRHAPSAIAPFRGDSRPATSAELTADTTATAVPPLRAVTRSTAKRQSVDDPPTTVVLHGPGSSEVFVKEGDTGGGEEGLVEVLMACVRDFQLTPERIGCSG